MFTYEKENRSTALETYEWDNAWLEQITDSTGPRVLYIGDSISCGIRRLATELSGNRVLFDGFGTSKAVDNPYFTDSLRLFSQQEGTRQAVLFNNGLHGWHLSNEEYELHYERMLEFLLSEFPKTPLYIVLTSSVADEARNRTVIERNNIACRLAEKHSLKTIDLYKASVEAGALLEADGVHFCKEGYVALASHILEALAWISAE